MARSPSHLSVDDTVGAAHGPQLQYPRHAAPTAPGALKRLGESFTKLKTMDFLGDKGGMGSHRRAVSRERWDCLDAGSLLYNQPRDRLEKRNWSSKEEAG